MEENNDRGERKNLFQKLKDSIFPIKEKDSDLKKLGKKTGFFLFLIMASIVTGIIVLAIGFAL